MFKNLFKRKKDPTPKRDNWETKVVWLPVGDAANPFQEEVLDCRAVALSFWSTTEDASVAASFNRLRASDGKESLGQLPQQALVVDCDLRYPFKREPVDGPLFLARQMEDKWDLYSYDRRLYIRRSWTGQLIHVAELEYTPDTVIVRRVHSEPNTVWGERDFAVAQLHFLIMTQLLRTLIPFPVPPDFPRTGEKAIALTGFNAYGRAAQFATYATYHVNAAPTGTAPP